MKKIWNPINSILGRQGEKNVDLKREAQECESFSYATLSAATNKFANNCKLGQGGSGSVYKGKLKDGREVAVKVLEETIRGTKEFENEVNLLSSLEHRNVVKLLGCCALGKKKLTLYEYVVKLLGCYAPPGKKNLLVYEYVPNNNLGQLLSNAELDWPQRYDIILGIACGLHHVHHHSNERIIHRDMKLANILIDENLKPKIADFGLSRTLLPEQSHVTTIFSGSKGYIAPELVSGARGVTVKTDVYSFGVVLLEIVSGKKFLEFQNENPNKSLLDWAYELYQNDRSLEFMDSNLEASAVTEQVEKCIAIGLLCVQGNPELRLDMKDVMPMLTKNQGHIRRSIGRPGLCGYPSRSWQQPQFPEDLQTLQETEELGNYGPSISGFSGNRTNRISSAFHFKRFVASAKHVLGGGDAGEEGRPKRHRSAPVVLGTQEGKEIRALS